ncbi:MAG: TonB-dependent receptor [Ignavibacteria bacterium]|nr:TonB-dependent receptor [Ignavibacteria bacterium]
MLSFLLVFSMLLDAHVHGVVRDSSTRQPLHGATVRVVGSTRGALTDRLGMFHLHDLEQDSVTLDVTYVGYTRERVRVGVSASDDVRIEVLLAPSSQQRGEIVVTDSKLTQSGLPTQRVDVLTVAEIDEHRGQTFADVLTQVPGVTVVQTGPSISKPMIHGMMGSRLVLRNNGIVQEGQQWGSEHAPEIDPFTPSRISVVKGPASVMYGPNAMGGVIDVVPRPLPESDGLHGEGSVNLFSNNWQGAGGAFIESRSLGDLPIGLRAQGAYRRAGDAATPNYYLTNTGFEEWSTGATLTTGDDDLGVTAMGSIFNTTLGIYKGSHMGNAQDLKNAIERGEPEETYPFSYEIANPRQEIAHTMLSVAGRLRMSSDALLRLTYGWQQNDRSEFDAHNTRYVRSLDSARDDVDSARDDADSALAAALQKPAMNLLLTTYSLDAAVDHELFGSARGTAGVSAQRQVNDRSGTVYLVPDYVAWGLGGFVYESMSWSTFTLSAGARYDVRWLDVSLQQRGSNVRTEQHKTFASVTASVGGLWIPSEEWSVNMNVATAWRPPQVNELYSNDVHHGTAIYEIGDSTLTAERSVGIDATVRYAVPGLEIEGTVYTNVFNGYILSLPDPNNPTITVRGTFPTYRFTQLPAIISGLDLSATVSLTQRLNVYASGSMVRGTDTENDQPLFLMPSDRLRLGTHIHADDVLFLHDAFIDISALGVRQQTRYTPGEDYAPPPPGYLLADVSVGGMIDISEAVQSRLTISCTNIFNTAYRDYLSRYRYFADDPGRNLIIRFTTTF